MIELDIAEAATIGARAEQQDAAAIVPLSPRGAALLVLADGLGGHANGAAAARLVVESFRDRAAQAAFNAPDERRMALGESLRDTNERMRAAANPDDGARSMGSTVVAAVLDGGYMRWISVGDSHLYVWRAQRLTKLNVDHSQAGKLLRQGYAADHPAVLRARSLLASALTGDPIEEIDSPADDISLAEHDVVLLASDGLDSLSRADIGRLIDRHAPEGARAIAEGLIDGVGALGLARQDNATVIVARICGAEAPGKAEEVLPEASPGAENVRSGQAYRALIWGLVLAICVGLAGWTFLR